MLRQPFTIWFDLEQYEGIRDIAHKTRMTKTALIREGVSLILEKYAKEPERKICSKTR